MEYDTILIDYDGTLADTYDLVMRSWKYMIHEITGGEADEKVLSERYGEPVSRTVRDFVPSGKEDEGVKIYRRFQEDRYPREIDLYPGAKKTLEYLKDKGCLLGLTTSRLAQTTLIGLEYFGITDMFGAIVTADDTEKFKPDPEPLLLTLSKLGSDPSRALMIGDSDYDLLAARNAGMAFCLVAWSHSITPALRTGDFTPDMVMNDWRELPGLIGLKYCDL